MDNLALSGYYAEGRPLWTVQVIRISPAFRKRDLCRIPPDSHDFCHTLTGTADNIQGEPGAF